MVNLLPWAGNPGAGLPAKSVEIHAHARLLLKFYVYNYASPRLDGILASEQDLTPAENQTLALTYLAHQHETVMLGAHYPKLRTSRKRPVVQPQNPRPALCGRALLMPQVNTGSPYRCGKRT